MSFSLDLLTNLKSPRGGGLFGLLDFYLISKQNPRREGLAFSSFRLLIFESYLKFYTLSTFLQADVAEGEGWLLAQRAVTVLEINFCARFLGARTPVLIPPSTIENVSSKEKTFSMAEGEGFEPSIPLRVNPLSKRAP
jgi:hypothetical protein